MKLLHTTNLYFFRVALVVFSLGGVLFYFLFQLIMDRDFNSRLQDRAHYYTESLIHSDSLLYFQHYSANSVGVRPISHFLDSTEFLSDTTIFDGIEHREIVYRQLSFNRNIHGKKYHIEVRRALIERKSIIEGVVALEGFLFIAFVAILVALNHQLSQTIWKPFYGILERIYVYKIDRAENLHFERQSITEFNDLATAIERMTDKIHHEFYVLKEFSENASHEIQTPLAIVVNKLELLLQSPDLSPDQIALISTASRAANRLSRLNEALIILSRIENRQFHAVEDISINTLVDQNLTNLDELIRMKDIAVTRGYSSPLTVKMSPYLADMLIENLVVNAIKHNVQGGAITIAITPRQILISNTGQRPTENPAVLFDRFRKSNQKSASLGLGLSIAKAIADTYQLPLAYTFSQNRHILSVEFPA